ncbi:MAG: biotin/lipoyl-binding protein [Lachnospiraceae bacterium]|nr:biotin/lipoyl-binding protein [Lachnospiraceae bacterium]
MMKRIFALLLTAALLLGLNACSAKEEEAVSVQSVSMLMGLGNAGENSRFSGVVTSGKTESIKKEEAMDIREIFVEVGQDVKAGDLLFTYDNAAFLLSLEQQRLELEGMRNTITATQEQIAELEAQREKVSDDNKLQYTLQIDTLSATLRETEYNIAVKEKELALKEADAARTEVCAGVTGRVTEINPDGGYDNYGNEKSFMTIIETGNLRIKGIINELNVSALYESCPVVIYSRSTSDVWTGTITMIDWGNPVQDNNYYYYDSAGGEMGTSSKYPFYVQLDSEEGLFIGQHVYIEAGYPAPETVEVRLAASFICDLESAPFVWARGKDGKLEKRSVTLGERDEWSDEYVIATGLSLEDYVAFPQEGLKAGMATVEWDESMFSGAGMTDDTMNYGGEEGYYDDGGLYMDDTVLETPEEEYAE